MCVVCVCVCVRAYVHVRVCVFVCVHVHVWTCACVHPLLHHILPPSHSPSPHNHSFPPPLLPPTQGIHNYLNFDQTQKTTSDEYIRLPQMVANEEARRALNRSPFDRALDDEEKAFMRDTWEGVAEGDAPPLPPRSQMKLSLGDLENDLLMREIRKDEDDHDRNVLDSGDSARQVKARRGREWCEGGGE